MSDVPIIFHIILWHEITVSCLYSQFCECHIFSHSFLLNILMRNCLQELCVFILLLVYLPTATWLTTRTSHRKFSCPLFLRMKPYIQSTKNTFHKFPQFSRSCSIMEFIKTNNIRQVQFTHRKIQKNMRWTFIYQNNSCPLGDLRSEISNRILWTIFISNTKIV